MAETAYNPDPRAKPLQWDQSRGYGNTGSGGAVSDEGTALPVRSSINFIGAGVSAVDNAGSDRTDVTISGGGSGDVVGPAGVTDGRLAIFDGATGKLLKGTGAGSMTGLLTIAQATANTSILASTGYSLTGSDTTPMIDLAGTWNTSGTPTAIKLNITNTSSPSLSPLIDLQVGGASQFSVTRAGGLTAVNGVFLGNISAATNGSTIALGGSLDVVLARDAADTLALRRTTNAQTFNVYGTFTDTSNYRRLSLTMTTGGAATISAAGLGTGVAGNELNLYVNALTPWRISSAGHLICPTDNAYDIGAAGATRPKDAYIAGSFVVGASGKIQFQARSRLDSASNGNMQVSNSAANDFGLFQFGGTTSSFPALKRSTTFLQGRLADDSGFCNVQGKLTTEANAVTETITPDKTLTLYDAAGTAYKVAVVAA